MLCLSIAPHAVPKPKPDPAPFINGSNTLTVLLLPLLAMDRCRGLGWCRRSTLNPKPFIAASRSSQWLDECLMLLWLSPLPSIVLPCSALPCLALPCCLEKENVLA